MTDDTDAALHFGLDFGLVGWPGCSLPGWSHQETVVTKDSISTEWTTISFLGTLSLCRFNTCASSYPRSQAQGESSAGVSIKVINDATSLTSFMETVDKFDLSRTLCTVDNL